MTEDEINVSIFDEVKKLQAETHKLGALHAEIANMMKGALKGGWCSETIAIFGNKNIQVHVIVTKDDDDWLEEVKPLWQPPEKSDD